MTHILMEITGWSRIAKADYDPDAQTLTVTNQSGSKETTYWPVTLEQFGRFQKAEDQGFFYLTQIKGGPWVTCKVKRLKPEVIDD